MKLINKDLTSEKLFVNVSEGEVYIEVFSKVHGKWKLETYFQKYEFIVDRELMDLTIETVKRLWKLKNPKLYICFGN